ncbi:MULTISPECIES: hypothetical protein [Paenibacillus]|uniref:hypothetical protein n=1 Tax=Paenibacillus TaxID=44249 RepID=UPI000F538884|nr:hypothetical protein [Paenibacillus xylanexedens]RPK20022.1 hypothetical protein EDO6_06539 [Paenibacillus xylanexedens]
MSKMEKIIKEAEYEVVQETEPVEQVATEFSLDDVAEMVMIGRRKDGTEFVQLVNTDDALKGKMYADYGARYFDMVIDTALFARLKGK